MQSLRLSISNGCKFGESLYDRQVSGIGLVTWPAVTVRRCSSA